MKRWCFMFQVGDRVCKRFTFGDHSSCSPNGTVIKINGPWIHVKHDHGKGDHARGVPPRFDYLAGELFHLNPLLRLVDEI